MNREKSIREIVSQEYPASQSFSKKSGAKTHTPISSRDLLQQLKKDVSHEKTEIISEGDEKKHTEIYTKLLPRNKNTPQIGCKKLDIMVSSTGKDNPELLHFLLRKTK